MPKTTWTIEQLEQLKEHYPMMPTPELAKRIGKSTSAVKTKATKLKLKKQLFSNNPWTAEKTDRLKELYPDHTNAEIAKTLGVTESAVSAKAFKLQLFTNPDFKQACARKTSFSKGHVPFNKGKKMPEATYDKCKATMFKKGHETVQTKYDNCISIRRDHEQRGGPPYKYIRLSKSKWIPLHVHIWQKKHGKIPKGMIVIFKDGDTMNCKIDNLEMISRAEHMYRNSASTNLTDGYIANTLAWRDKETAHYIKNHHPELIELKRQSINLKRAINEQAAN